MFKYFDLKFIYKIVKIIKLKIILFYSPLYLIHNTQHETRLCYMFQDPCFMFRSECTFNFIT